MLGAAYVDASALVKLIHAEPESAALAEALDSHPAWVSAEILAVEAMRIARRLGGDAPEQAREALARVRLVPFTATIRDRACDLEPPLLHALDAIHLASALQVREILDVLYGYDTRLLGAAERHGLALGSPS